MTPSERQLANLKRGNPDHAFEAGNPSKLTHGLRDRSPLRRLDNEWVNALRDEILAAIPARDADGRVALGDQLQADVLAIMGVQVLHAAGYFAAHPDEGLPALETWSRLAERYSRGLERVGIGASARARLGLDMARGASLAEQWAADAERESADREAQAGPDDIDGKAGDRG
jgi:hypothetical protein